MDSKQTITIYDCNTGFVAVWDKQIFTAEEFGEWSLAEIQAAHQHAVLEGVIPCTHIALVELDDADLRAIEVEELICHGQLEKI
jgi:hypothetical protein